MNVVALPFILSFPLTTDVNLYLVPRLENDEPTDLTKDFAALKKHPDLDVLALDKTKFFYHIKKLTDIYYLYISPFVTPNILAIAYGEDHPSFAHYYKIISCS